jgi:hypothetical protein
MTTYKMGPAAQQVFDSVQDLGFTFTGVDTDLPRIPVDLTVIGSSELMSLMVQYSEYANFASTQLSFASVDERHAHRRAEDKHNELVAALSSASSGERSGRSSGITMHKSQASARPEYQQLKEAAEYASAYVTVLKSVYENLDRSLKILSREVTRRASSDEQRRNRWTA